MIDKKPDHLNIFKYSKIVILGFALQFALTALAKPTVEQAIADAEAHRMRLVVQGQAVIDQFPEFLPLLSRRPELFKEFIIKVHDKKKVESVSELRRWGYPEGLPSLAEIFASFYNVSRFDPSLSEADRNLLGAAIKELNRMEGVQRDQFIFSRRISKSMLAEIEFLELVIDNYDTRMFRGEEVKIKGPVSVPEYFRTFVHEVVKFNWGKPYVWTSENREKAALISEFLNTILHDLFRPADENCEGLILSPQQKIQSI